MSDYVSKQAVIDYLMKNMGWYDEDGRLVDDWSEKEPFITELIKGVPTGWISVKERLPEDDGDYLVYTREKYIGLFWFDRDEKEWIEESDFPCLEGYVTHWMPRPEPPNTDQ